MSHTRFMDGILPEARLLFLAVFVVFIFSSSGNSYPYPDGLPLEPNNRETVSTASSSSGTSDVFCLLDSATVTTSEFDSGSDIWGWESPDGTEYAIMGVTDGIAFVDVSSMQVVQRVDDDCGGGTTWRDFKTYGHYCYAVTECGGAGRGLMIIDMSGLPSSIRVVKTVATTNFSSWHNLSIDTTKGFAYLAKQNSGILMYSLADPENPVKVGSFISTFCHDLYVDNDTAWVAEASLGVWSIWDLSNKNAPVEIHEVSVPNPGFVHNIWPSSDRSFAVSTEETSGKTVKIWDTQDMNNIQLVGEYLAPNGLAHNAHVIGDTLYLSHYTSGVVALDLTNPSSPVEIDRFDTFPPSESGGGGCWGIFPHTSSGKIYASNMNGELFVFGQLGMGVDIRFGAAPLDVQLSSATCRTVNSWDWQFGDGGSSSMESPMHTFAEAGLQSVSLQVTTPDGTFSTSSASLVLVHAETLSVANVSGAPSETIRIDYSFFNHLPTTGMVIPFNWSGPLSLKFDSISTKGLRTEFMGDPFQINLQESNKRAIFSLSSSSATLAPGNGPVMSLYLTLPSIQLSFENTITSIGYGLVSSATISFPQGIVEPVAIIPGIVTMGCCNGSTGNVDGVGSVDIADLTLLIDHLFINFPALSCPEEANIDGDGGIDIADLTALIDHLFINFPATANCQ